MIPWLVFLSLVPGFVIFKLRILLGLPVCLLDQVGRTAYYGISTKNMISQGTTPKPGIPAGLNVWGGTTFEPLPGVLLELAPRRGRIASN